MKNGATEIDQKDAERQLARPTRQNFYQYCIDIYYDGFQERKPVQKDLWSKNQYCESQYLIYLIFN
jgi:hypothetical protein